MKIKLSFVFFLCLTKLCLNAQEGKLYKENHKETNTLWRTGTLLPENKPHGKWKYYYTNGKLEKIVNWDNGLEHGKFIRFNINTEVQEITTYSYGKKEGVYEEYNQGNLRKKGEYKNDQLSGIWQTYYNNDVYPENKNKVEYEITFKDGYTSKIKYWKYNTNIEYSSDDGYYVIYNQKIQLKNPILLNGIFNIYEYTGKSDEYYENGQLFKTGYYKQGKKEGSWQYYYKNGAVWEEGVYQEGEKIGVWKEYFDNKKPMSIYNYILDPTGHSTAWGVAKIYDKNDGVLSSEDFYDFMRKEYKGLMGASVPTKSLSYYKNGVISKEEKTVYLEKQTTKLFDINGNLKKISIHLFKENEGYSIPTGTWKYYNEDGSLEKTETYIDGVKQ